MREIKHATKSKISCKDVYSIPSSKFNVIYCYVQSIIIICAAYNYYVYFCYCLLFVFKSNIIYGLNFNKDAYWCANAIIMTIWCKSYLDLIEKNMNYFHYNFHPFVIKRWIFYAVRRFVYFVCNEYELFYLLYNDILHLIIMIWASVIRAK